MLTKKRGGTVVTFALIAGMLVIGTTLFFVLQGIALKQAEHLNQDEAIAIINDIEEGIATANAYPTDAKYEIEISVKKAYKAGINDDGITLTIGKTKIKRERPKTTLNIISNNFENEAKLTILKVSHNVYVTPDPICITTDDVCSPTCLFLHICDKACYSNYGDGVCIPECVDSLRDDIIDLNDRDDICDPDCYANKKEGVYDPDCPKEGDGTCDKDTPKKEDGICDMDCFSQQGVCDVDCPTWRYKYDHSGNRISDGKGDYKKETDLDCPSCSNSICEIERGDNCLTCITDCPKFDDSIEQKCAPQCLESDLNGWLITVPLGNDGDKCIDECDCKGICVYDKKKPEERRCCKKKYRWNTEKQKCEPIKTDVLIVTTRTIYDKLGQELLDKYIEALEKDDYSAQVIRLDDQGDIDSCGEGLAAAPPSVPDETAQILIPTCAKTLEIKHIIILGGQKDIEQKAIPVGACEDGPQGYTHFYTDDYYGDTNADELPEVAVGRIPCGLDQDINPIRNYIQDTAIPMHQNKKGIGLTGSRFGYIMDDSPDPSHSIKDFNDYVWVTDNWGGGSQTCEQINYCYMTPPNSGGGPNWQQNTQFFYLLVHGQPYDPEFIGGTTTFAPTDIANRDWTQTMAIMVPCYGGRIHNVQNIGDSNMLMSFMGTTGDPVAIYLGGTATQMGSAPTPKDLCNTPTTACLYNYVWDLLSTKKSAGESFREAKTTYLTNHQASFSCTYRIGHQTMYYGDPTIRVYETSQANTN